MLMVGEVVPSVIKPGTQAQAKPVGVNAMCVAVKTVLFDLAVHEHVQMFCFRSSVFMTRPRALAVPDELCLYLCKLDRASVI